jgi:hypothetical protein
MKSRIFVNVFAELVTVLESNCVMIRRTTAHSCVCTLSSKVRYGTAGFITTDVNACCMRTA